MFSSSLKLGSVEIRIEDTRFTFNNKIHCKKISFR